MAAITTALDVELFDEVNCINGCLTADRAGEICHLSLWGKVLYLYRFDGRVIMVAGRCRVIKISHGLALIFLYPGSCYQLIRL